MFFENSVQFRPAKRSLSLLSVRKFNALRCFNSDGIWQRPASLFLLPFQLHLARVVQFFLIGRWRLGILCQKLLTLELGELVH